MQTQIDTPLGKDELIIKEYQFSYSLILFFLTSHFLVTNKRLIVKHPNVILFIPTGNDTITYPLRQIAGIKTKTEFKFVSLFLGVIFFLIGISAIKSWGLFLTLLGIVFLVKAFRTVIAVAVASGGVVAYSHVPWESKDAKQMINQLNQLIAEL